MSNDFTHSKQECSNEEKILYIKFCAYKEKCKGAIGKLKSREYHSLLQHVLNSDVKITRSWEKYLSTNNSYWKEEFDRSIADADWELTLIIEDNESFMSSLNYDCFMSNFIRLK